MKNLFLTLLLVSCSKPTVEPVKVEPTAVEEIRFKISQLESEAAELSDENGLLIQDQCDAPLWNGKYCSDRTKMSAYEENGRYWRTTDRVCLKDNRSGSDWSRDMSLGLLNCLIEQADLGAIERHIAYGEANGWVMGDGLKSRTVYSPALISLWYKAARILGHDYGYIEIGNIYTEGLIDYQAHLQMLFIKISGELDGAITDVMLARIDEHSGRIPLSTFFESLRAKYRGDVSAAIDGCLSSDRVVGDYVRCSDGPCELAEQIFSCKMVLNILTEE